MRIADDIRKKGMQRCRASLPKLLCGSENKNREKKHARNALENIAKFTYRLPRLDM